MPDENQTYDEGLIEIDLVPGDADILIALFVGNNFTKESSTVFNECMAKDYGIEKSIFHATLNEAIVVAVRDQISRAMISASKEACNANVES